MVSEMLSRILDNLIDLSSLDNMPAEEHPFNKLVAAIAELEASHVNTHQEIVNHMINYHEVLQNILNDTFKMKESIYHLASAMREFSEKFEKAMSARTA